MNQSSTTLTQTNTDVKDEGTRDRSAHAEDEKEDKVEDEGGEDESIDVRNVEENVSVRCEGRAQFYGGGARREKRNRIWSEHRRGQWTSVGVADSLETSSQRE